MRWYPADVSRFPAGPNSSPESSGEKRNEADLPPSEANDDGKSVDETTNNKPPEGENTAP